MLVKSGEVTVETTWKGKPLKVAPLVVLWPRNKPRIIFPSLEALRKANEEALKKDPTLAIPPISNKTKH